MTNIIVCGCLGKMGNAVTGLVAQNDDCKIVAGVDISAPTNLDYPVYHNIDDVTEKADAIIDFSHPSLLDGILRYVDKEGIAAILCTTGYSDEQTKQIKAASATSPIFYSRNMSLGINLLIELVKKANDVLGDAFDIEVVEKHHNQKIDAPSGTALMIADAINESDKYKYVYDRHSQLKRRDKNEIGIHAVRGGTIVGEHEVIFAGNHEVLSISHTAYSKELFATGAVKAAIFMTGKENGLYDMSDLI